MFFISKDSKPPSSRLVLTCIAPTGSPVATETTQTLGEGTWWRKKGTDTEHGEEGVLGLPELQEADGSPEPQPHFPKGDVEMSDGHTFQGLPAGILPCSPGTQVFLPLLEVPV